jgi:cell division septation protein DedD
VCAILLVIGWSLALISYIVRRRKKKTRAKKVAAGVKPPKPVPQPPEKYIIPPDPAVVLGQREPGEHVIVESKHRNGRRVKHSRTMPETQEFHEENGEGSDKPFGKLAHSNTEPLSPHEDHHPLTNGGAM